MYIRRKVFSRFEDENGIERLFSTTEFEKDFSDMLADMELENRKYRAFDPSMNSGERLSKRQLNKEAEETVRQTKAKDLRDKLDEVNAKHNYTSSEEAKDLQAELDKLSPKAKESLLKRIYGKDAAHRGRNIALTGAAVAGLGAAGYGVHKALKNKKAKKEEEKKGGKRK